MGKFLTSNQLSEAHGDSPMVRREPASKLTRGFILYISLTREGLATRQFYYDFDDTISNQVSFECAVLKAAASGSFDFSDLDLPPEKRRPFPHVFSIDVDVVHYGWVPCKVTYMLDNANFAFQLPDGSGSPDALRQPIVFRRDKIVSETKGGKPVSKIETGYLANHAFYNLMGDASMQLSCLRFDNLMTIDENRTPIPQRPADPNKAAATSWLYCMDIYLELRQAGPPANASGAAPKPVVIVFDPPQGNGGHGGPP